MFSSRSSLWGTAWGSWNCSTSAKQPTSCDRTTNGKQNRQTFSTTDYRGSRNYKTSFICSWNPDRGHPSRIVTYPRNLDRRQYTGNVICSSSNWGKRRSIESASRIKSSSRAQWGLLIPTPTNHSSIRDQKGTAVPTTNISFWSHWTARMRRWPTSEWFSWSENLLLTTAKSIQFFLEHSSIYKHWNG